MGKNMLKDKKNKIEDKIRSNCDTKLAKLMTENIHAFKTAEK